MSRVQPRMRFAQLVLLSTLSCRAATPVVARSCTEAAGRAAMSRDGQWVVLARGDDVLVFSSSGSLVKTITPDLHHALDAFFIGSTHVVAVVGTDDGGWHHAVLLSVPDGADLADASEIGSIDPRGPVVYFDTMPHGDAMHTLDVVTRKMLPNGAPPPRWENPDAPRPVSAEDPHARAIAEGALCR